ncbi:negative regulator of glucose-controlled proteins [Homalodisca vitripennis]|nr:negative regulator of glucose-controlled proteins [Homalodisca vitripennis]
MGIPVSSRIPVLNCGSGSEWARSMSASAPPGLRFGSAVLLAMVFWCAMWTSQCDGVASASPLHRTDITGEMISVDSRRGDTPQYSDYSTYRPSALLKRSRRISRTFPGTAVGFSRGFSKSLKSSDFQQPCSHVGDLINDVAARAYLAGTVFEGKARSRSSVREPGGTYAVTFSVQHVHKDHSPGTLRLRSQVRLQFREKAGGPRAAASGPCVQNYNYTGVGLVRANIKRGGKYLVFVSGVGPHNFTVVGEPVFRSKKNLQAVRDVLCHNCAEKFVYHLRWSASLARAELIYKMWSTQSAARAVVRRAGTSAS